MNGINLKGLDQNITIGELQKIEKIYPSIKEILYGDEKNKK